MDYNENSPPLNSNRPHAMMVWGTGEKIIRTALCWIEYHSCAVIRPVLVKDFYMFIANYLKLKIIFRVSVFVFFSNLSFVLVVVRQPWLSYPMQSIA